jgi:hypothetical protein
MHLEDLPAGPPRLPAADDGPAAEVGRDTMMAVMACAIWAMAAELHSEDQRALALYAARDAAGELGISQETFDAAIKRVWAMVERQRERSPWPAGFF